MPKKAKAVKTPSRIMADIITCGMALRGDSITVLAKKLNLHRNTVYLDLQSPERIPQDRLWLYFVALELPIDDVLNRIAQRLCEEITDRR